MASSRKLPASYNTSTYDSAGGKDYSSIAAWEAATDVDMIGSGELLSCYSGVHDDIGSLSGARNTSPTEFRIIRPAVGEGHLGIPLSDGSVVTFSITGDFIFKLDENYARVEDLVLTLTLNTATEAYAVTFLENGTAAIGCLVYDCTNLGSGGASGFLVNHAGDTVYIVNCMAKGCKTYGVFNSLSTACYEYNNIYIDNGVYGSYDSNASAIRKNCLADNNTSADYSGGTMTNCGSSDTTGSAGLQNLSYKFRLPGSNNFLYSAGSDGIFEGTDLSGDAAYPFDDDILQTVRTVLWDIGFNEFIPAVVGPYEKSPFSSPYEISSFR